MTPMEAEKERTIRFYQFAKADFQREVRGDYRLLRLTGDAGAVAAIDVLALCSIEQQLVLANAIVKSAHSSGVLLSGGSFTEMEKSAAKVWHERQVAGALSLDSQRVIRSRQQPAVKLKTLRLEMSRRDLKRFGTYVDRSHEFGYRIEIGDWTLDTLCALVNRPYFGYRYNHLVTPTIALDKPHEFDVLGNQYERHAITNFPRWLAQINAPFTVETEEEIPGRVDGLLTVWDHFHSNVGPILESIRIT